jgi:RHS repeat-associated protein
MTTNIRGSILRAQTRFWTIICLVAGLSAVTLGQSAARPDRGIRPGGSYSISDLENISLTNGNVNLSIPLASLPPVAGGKLSWDLRAIYNSKLWDVWGTEFAPQLPVEGYTANAVQQSTIGGWQVGGIYSISMHHVSEDYAGIIPTDPNDPESTFLVQYVWKMVLTTPDGATHELRPMGYSSYPGSRDWARGYYKDTPRSENATMRYYSFDGSFLYARVDPYPVEGFPTSWDAYLPDGTRISRNAAVQPAVEKITDTNGNQIRIYTEVNGSVVTTHYRDHTTCNTGTCREILAESDSPTHTAIKYQTVEGTWVTVDLNWGSTHVQGRLYPCGDPCGSELELNTELTVLQSIVMPLSDSGPRQQFQFGYNSDTAPTVNIPANYTQCGRGHGAISAESPGLGSLSHMETPMGTIVDYKFRRDRDDPTTGGLIIEANDIPGETITKKTVTHDGTADVWSYEIGLAAGMLTGPDGSVTTETFYPHDPGISSYVGGPKAGLVYRTNGSGKVVVERQWVMKQFSGGNNDGPGGALASFNPVVDAEYTTLIDNSSPPQPVKMSVKTFQYDYNGNLTSESDYDWFSPSSVNRDAQGVPTGVPASATLLRVTTTSYHSQADDPGSTNVYAKRDLTTVTPFILNAPKEMTVGNGAATLSKTRIHYDDQGYNTLPIKGNVTTQRSDKDGVWIDVTHTYDAYGNRLTTTQPSSASPSGNTTTLVYDASTHAQPTSITVDPLNGTGIQTTQIGYDYYTGLVRSQTDANLKTTDIGYINQLTLAFDPYGRPGVITAPAVTSTIDGVTSPNQQRKTLTKYFDNARQIETITDLKQQSDGLLRSRTSSDRLGRVTLVETSENGSTYTISSQTLYKNDPTLKRSITKVSNPSRGDGAQTDGWTRTIKDDLGRVIEVATFSGPATSPPPDSGTNTSWTGSVTTSYNAEQTTVTDQAGKKRRSLIDGIGRLKQVDELNDTGSLYASTFYAYDSRGNLTQVDQGSQQRLFTYDSLSRLKTAKNPEQVMVATTYDYDDASNLMTKTAPNSTSVGFTYDGLNRVKTKTLSSGGVWVYSYDVGTNFKGRMVSEVLQGSTDGYYYDGYDAIGRVTASRQVTTAGAANTYTMSYGYDLAGNLTTQTYPSGKEYRTSYDNAGRVASVSRHNSGVFDKTYASGFSYAAHGAVGVVQLGNGKWEHTLFNGRLQPTEIGLGASSAASDLLKLEYKYGVLVSNVLDTTQNNGNIQSQIITAPKTQSGNLVLAEACVYDSLNRLAQATETGGTNEWSQTYSYDRFGNRAVAGTIFDAALTPPSLGAFDSATNRIKPAVMTGFSYDTAGSLTSDPHTPANGIIYDAENRQTSYTKTGVGTTSYSYDGDGHRVKKTDPSNNTTIFVYNVAGQLIAEYTSGAPSGNGTSYLTSDHLGSTRVVTSAAGGGGSVTVQARYDYLPFGEEIDSSIGSRSLVTGYGASNGTRQKFTQKERDNESGLDYFLARYYSSAQGRFTGVDPVDFTMYRVVNPQAWNKYSYVANQPLKFTDPSGKIIQFRNEEDAKKALALYQAGLAKDQRNAVSFEKDKKGNFILKVDAKAAGKAGADSLLGRLNKATTTERVAVVDFVNRGTKFEVIRFGIASSKETTSFTQEEGKSQTITPGSLAGLTLPEFGDKSHPLFNASGFNSAEPGKSRILISNEQTVFTPAQAIYAETLAHFQTFAETGDARKAVHPRVDADERKIANQVGQNEKQK